VLLLSECLLFLFISLSTQYGNFLIHPRTSDPLYIFTGCSLVKYRMSSWHGTYLSTGTTLP